MAPCDAQAEIKRLNQCCHELTLDNAEYAKLQSVQLQRIERLMRALERAYYHLDMGELKVSHCTDHDMIEDALAQPAQNPPAPLKHISNEHCDCVSYCAACRLVDPQTGLQPGEQP